MLRIREDFIWKKGNTYFYDFSSDYFARNIDTEGTVEVIAEKNTKGNTVYISNKYGIIKPYGKKLDDIFRHIPMQYDKNMPVGIPYIVENVFGDFDLCEHSIKVLLRKYNGAPIYKAFHRKAVCINYVEECSDISYVLCYECFVENLRKNGFPIKEFK